MRKLRAILTILCGIVLLSGGIASAQPIIQPEGLAPGQQYRIVFSTAGSINATSSDIDVYNSFVTSQANSQTELLDLNTTWSAVVSVSDPDGTGPLGAVDARDNTNTNPNTDPGGIPIYNLQGELIAIDYSELWDGDNLTNAIQFDQTGSVSTTGNQVWTGTRADGTGDIGFRLGESSTPTFGRRNQTNQTWIVFDPRNNSSTTLNHIYAISGILEAAAIPEPGSMALAGTLAVIGLTMGRRRRQRRPPHIAS